MTWPDGKRRAADGNTIHGPNFRKKRKLRLFTFTFLASLPLRPCGHITCDDCRTSVTLNLWVAYYEGYRNNQWAVSSARSYQFDVCLVGTGRQSRRIELNSQIGRQQIVIVDDLYLQPRGVERDLHRKRQCSRTCRHVDDLLRWSWI